MEKTRLLYLDVLKAVSIIMVVFCHYVMIPWDSFLGTIFMVLTYAAVPCFLMCSGYVLLFKKESLLSVVRRIVHVYSALFVWKGLYLLFFSSFFQLQGSKHEILQYLLFFDTVSYENPNANVGHLWFIQGYLMCLLVLPIVSPLFVRREIGTILWTSGLAFLSGQLVISGQFILNGISSLLSVSKVNIETITAITPFNNGYAFCLFFFLVGGILHIFDEKDFLKRRTVLYAGCTMLLVGVVGLMVVRYLEMRTWLWEERYLPYAYQWFSTVLLSVGLFIVVRNFNENGALRWIGTHIGKNTMGIFYFHWPLLFLIWYGSTFWYSLPQKLWVHFAKTIIVVLVASGLTTICKKAPILKKLVS